MVTALNDYKIRIDDVSVAYGRQTVLRNISLQVPANGIFAIIGPVAVAMTLGWVERLLTAYQATSAELEATNRDLERRIDERTAHLAEAGEQLRVANEELASVNDELRQLEILIGARGAS